jgi:hypothetical protein
VADSGNSAIPPQDASITAAASVEADFESGTIEGPFARVD